MKRDCKKAVSQLPTESTRRMAPFTASPRNARSYLRAGVACLMPPFLVTVLAIASTAGSLASEPETEKKVTAAFSSFVCSDYEHRQPLRGWLASRLVIRESLSEWYTLQAGTTVTDGSAADLRTSWASLCSDRTAPLTIGYLGFVKTSSGDIRLTGGTATQFPELLARAKPARRPLHIIILDCCHAGTVSDVLRSLDSGSQWLLAATTGERTFELNVRRRQPVNLARHYPRTVRWLKRRMPENWDGRISFLGFIWIDTFLRTPHPPGPAAEWRDFLNRCAETAAAFRQNHSRRLASTVTVVIP